jgi:hypothetical protein
MTLFNVETEVTLGIVSRRVNIVRIRLLTFVVLLINRFAIVSTYQRSDLLLLGLDLAYRVEDKQLGDASRACEASIFGRFPRGRNLYRSLITGRSQILFCNLWRLE